MPALHRLLIVAAICCCVSAADRTASASSNFRPGELWPDTDGVHINAHGGGVLVYNGTYYWFGESRDRGTKAVSCYSSKDLYNWKNEGIALAMTAGGPATEISRGNVIERPKVLHNPRTGKFVMWFHTELRGQDYNAARTSVAVSDHITGPYALVRSYRPNAGQWPLNLLKARKRARSPKGLSSKAARNGSTRR
jgi:hypothetical protein